MGTQVTWMINALTIITADNMQTNLY